MTDILVTVGAALAGVAVVGPLLNHAVIHWIGWRVVLPPCFGRVAARQELGRTAVGCTRCGTRLATGGIPALPATLVGGRCRRCGAGLARRYLALEWVTGALFAVAAAVVGPSIELVPVLALVAGAVAMSAVDLTVLRIPTRFVYVTAAGVVGGLLLVAAVDGPARRLGGAAVGAAVYGGFLLVLHLISPRSLGFGDVRLATLVGVAVGWGAWRPDLPVLAPVQSVLHAGLLAGVLGSVAGVVLLVLRGRDHPFPFGPALAAGGVAVLLAVV